MRTILDGVDPNELVPVFTDIHRMASSAKILPKYRVLDGRYLVGVDASEYFLARRIATAIIAFR